MKQTFLTQSGAVYRALVTAAMIGLGLGYGSSIQAAHLASDSANPTVPYLINYQGTLQDASGNPLPTGEYELSFSVWSAASGGSMLWGPQKLNGLSGSGLGPRVPVVSGRFNVVLGPVDITDRPLVDVFNQGSTFLEITVGTGAPIAPRQRIMPNAFAFNAAMLNGFTWDSLFKGGNPETGALFIGQDPAASTAENGSTTSFPMMDVSGRIRLRQGSHSSAGLWLRQNSSSNDRGFIGMASDDQIGLFGAPLGDYGLRMDVNNGKVTMAKGAIVGSSGDAGVNFSQWSDSLIIIGQPFRSYTNRIFGEFHRLFGFGGYYNLVVEAPSQLEVRAPASVFTGTISATSVTQTSDQRLKTEIEKISNPLEILSKIDGVSYRFNADAELAKTSGFSLPTGRQVGVLAQEVEKVLPEAVKEDPNGLKSVNYNGLTSVLIEAIKQQQKELEALRSEVKALREQRQP